MSAVERGAAALVWLLVAIPVCAQTVEPLPGRVEASVGVSWNGRVSFDSRNAAETTSSGDALALFTTSTELGAAPSVDARFGVRVLPSLDAEVHGSFGSPELRSTITFDLETSATPIVVADTVQHFSIGADALWYLPAPRVRRTRVFVAAGAGYLRQLEDRGTVIVSTATIDVGGGAKILLRSRPSRGVKGVGARIDARAVVRGAAIAIDSRTHIAPTVGASLFLRF